MNLSVKQKHGHRKWTGGCQGGRGVGEGRNEISGLAEANYCIDM